MAEGPPSSEHYHPLCGLLGLCEEAAPVGHSLRA